jgi:hypothetical protein
LDVQGWLTPSGSIFVAVGMTVPLEDHLMERRAKEAQGKATWGVEHGLIKRVSDVRPLRRDGYEGFEIDFDNPDGSKTFTAGLQSLKEPTQLIQLQWTPKTTEQSSLEAFGRAVNSVHLLTVFGDYQPIEGRWLLLGAGLLLALLTVVGIRSAALRFRAKEGIVDTGAATTETALCANMTETSCVTAISEQGGKENQHGNDERHCSPSVTRDGGIRFSRG